MNYSNEKPVRKTRRDFLKYLLTGGIAGLVISIFYPIISYLKPPKQNGVEVSSVKVGKLSKIEKDSGRIIRFGNKPVILLRTKSGQLRAFSAVCTHLNCTVQFRKDLELIWCACHNGKYDLHGRNISGPPPRPLAPYRVVVKGGEVFVSKLT
jgi:cytochrome b6-f complex iron-sulfur subunit